MNVLNRIHSRRAGSGRRRDALLVAGIGLVIFTGVNTFGTRMNQIYIDLATAVDNLVQ